MRWRCGSARSASGAILTVHSVARIRPSPRSSTTRSFADSTQRRWPPSAPDIRPCACSVSDLLYRAGLYLPDVRGVIGYRPVAGERASMADVEDRLARPGRGVPVQGTDLGLGLDVRRQVCQVHVVIAVPQEHVDNRGEDPRFGRAEGVGGNHVQGPSSLRLLRIVPMWIIPAPAAHHLVRCQAKEEEMVLPGLVRHLDGGAIAGADGEGTVHHELHIAGAAGFKAGRRDL